MTLTKDRLIREYENRRGTLPALLGVYGLILGTMLATGYAII